jgi:hypothetical protein
MDSFLCTSVKTFYRGERRDFETSSARIKTLELMDMLADLFAERLVQLE